MTTPRRRGWLTRVKRRLQGTALHPRWIGAVYIDPAMRAAAKHASGVLLDVGCGQRPHHGVFAGRVSRYVGIDRPARMTGSPPDVVADAQELPFRTGSVDTLLATELLEHLPSPERFLSEACRVLRPGGVLIVSVPFMEPLHEEPRDFYRFTPYGLRTVLERHGHRVIDLTPKGGWFSVVLGSFLNQSVYAWANPEGESGERRDNPIALAIVLPFCALAQWAGYALDRVVPSSRYTLGYVAVARSGQPSSEAPCAAR